MKASNNKEEEPHFVKRDKFAITAEYKQWFADIKSRLRNSQIKAAIKVNSTLLELSLIHISEPTRQAEISYAVFCLKKKKNTSLRR